jgi:hypothetical protein
MSTNSNARETEPAMSDRINQSQQIDRPTSRSICRAVGERLRQDLPENSELPAHLRCLMDELQRRDRRY